ncbi:MAG: hypothetical protein DI570_12595 [Phenylobacterium zucineum]|nr:MAG: hypothetical protein DI570_12595 [Phenylobacterium zucineum]
MTRAVFARGLARTGVVLTSALALGSCAAYGGKPLAPVSAAIVQPPTLEIGPPDAVVEPTGVRFHGWACTGSAYGATPRAIRVERLDANGQVVDSAYGRLMLMRGRASRDCSVYDIPTDWPASAAANVRICASDSSQSCEAGGR